MSLTASNFIKAILPEAVALFLRLSRMRDLLGIDEMPRPPVALYEPPGASDVDGIPAIAEAIVLEPHARLIAGGLAVAFDHHAVEAGVAAESFEKDVIRLGAVLYTAQQTHRCVAPKVLIELHRV